MMIHEINLLPPAVSAARAHRIYLGRSGRLLRSMIFLAGLMLLLLGGVYLVVWRTNMLVEADLGHEDERTLALLRDVGIVNAQMEAVAAWRDEHEAWTPLIPKLLAAMPTGILLTSLGVEAERPVLKIEGTFSQRETLVTFQRRLEGLEWVAKVESPLSNFETGNAAQFILLVFRGTEPL